LFHIRLKQAETIYWDDPTTLGIANEQRDIFRLDVDLLQPAR